MAVHDKAQYDAIASIYDVIETLPMASLYTPLVQNGLGDCTGKTILDLGGGTGTHARQALQRGAARVDVVDSSPAMLEEGKRVAHDAGMGDRLRWYVGDVSKPLAHLPLDAQYDAVMVNWTFDHAENLAELEGMWRNTAAYVRPNGRVVSIRMSAWDCEAGRTGKYGTFFTDVEPIPDGVKYIYHAKTTPPMECPATTLTASLDFEQSKAMAERHGFVNFKQVPVTETEVFKKDPEYWQTHLDGPSFIVIEATKAA